MPLSEEQHVVTTGVCSWSQTPEYTLVVPDSAKRLAAKAVAADTARKRQSIYQSIIDLFRMHNLEKLKDNTNRIWPQLVIRVENQSPPQFAIDRGLKCYFVSLTWNEMKDEGVKGERPHRAVDTDIGYCEAKIWALTPKERRMTGGMAGFNNFIDACNRWLDICVFKLPYSVGTTGFYRRGRDLRRLLLETPYGKDSQDEQEVKIKPRKGKGKRRSTKEQDGGEVAQEHAQCPSGSQDVQESVDCGGQSASV